MEVVSTGAGPAIGRFSLAHHITGSGAWVAALVMMALADVLTRLAVVWLRGHLMPDDHEASLRQVEAIFATAPRPAPDGPATAQPGDEGR